MTQSQKSVAFYTLGCKLNFAETSTISEVFRKNDFRIVDFGVEADFYVINTCSVTSNANKKGRNAISRAINKNPEAVVIVTGCYAQLKPDEIKENFKKVDYILGANNKHEIENIILNFEKKEETVVLTTYHKDMKEYFPAITKGDRTRAFIKVQDGCDYFCAFCTIPFARGRSRNQEISKTVEQTKNLAKEGIKEIIISGVNVGDFGKSTNERFVDLLHEFVKIDGLERIRIGSIEPNLLTDEIIELVAKNDKLMPHFHIPLQSGSDEILKKISRKYNTQLFRSKIEKVKKEIPDAFIGIDLIVGVNGETEDDFRKTLDFINSIDISFIHHFQYSERENTRALAFTPVVSPTEKHRRARQITAISNLKHNAFMKSQIGKEFNVLFESTKKDNKMFGFTENYIKVETDYNKEYTNKIIRCKAIMLSENETVIVKAIQ